MKAIEEAIATLYPYNAKPGQREALHHLIYHRKDLILIAGTGFGKSIILQAVSVLLQKSTTIVILPLDQIGNEQSDYIRQIGGIPCFLNKDTICPKLLNEVQHGCFTHVLVSPELAIGDQFRPVASSPSFKQQVSLVVVDEAHLVHHWGRNFRAAYSRLKLLRSWLGSQIPWFACSATLDPETLESLKSGISFDPDVKVQRTSIDRPELLFRIGWIPKKAGYKPLRFLFAADEKTTESVYQRLSEIPKTIIFFDSRKDAHTAAEECQAWLQDIKPEWTYDNVTQSLKTFHRNTASANKDAILTEFGKEGARSQVRVIFATEALGMGVDLRDIRRTVQWGVPIGEHAATQLQRGGRASRDKLDGEMIMLLPEWVSGERSSGPKQRRSQKQGQGPPVIDAIDTGLKPEEEARKAKKLTDKQRRDHISDFWYNLANSERKDPPMCIRRQFLDFFDERNEYQSGRRPNRCCSNCNPHNRLGKLDGFYQYHELGPQANQRTRRVSEALSKWAEEQACLLYKDCAFLPESALFLSPDLRDKLAKNAHSVLDIESLRMLMGPWYWRKSHEQALFDIIWTSYRQANAKTPSTQASRSQTPGLSSQSTLIACSFDLSTPSTSSQDSGPRNYQVVGLSPLSTPLPWDSPMQSQDSCPNLLSKETVNASPLSRPVTLKRSALEPISGNIRGKKMYTRNT